MLRLTLVIAAALAVTGCQKDTGCDTPKEGCPIDGSLRCTVSSACKSQNASLPVCDLNLNGGTCVACTSAEHDFCTNNTPRCDKNTCVACAEDVRDCGTGSVCLPSGACAGPNNIIHANSNGSSDADCGAASKPCTLSNALTVIMTAPGKTVIKLDDPGPYTPFSPTNFVVDVNVTLDMRGATLNRNSDGPLVEIKAGKTVTLMGGTIEGAHGTNGDGILCNGNLTLSGTTIRMAERSAINMSSGCNLIASQINISNTSTRGGTSVAGIVDGGDSIILSRSTIMGNHAGGLAINSGTFTIVGNAFLNNGDDLSSTGGIAISTSPNMSNLIAFNTISGNSISDGTKSSGIDCNAGTATVGHNNIVWKNKQKTAGTAFSQISGGCKQAYSVIGPPPVLTLNDGGNNSNSDPLLTNEMSDPRLKVGSPAIGAADPTADLTGLAALDLNGDPRAKRAADKGADIGADQYKP